MEVPVREVTSPEGQTDRLPRSTVVPIIAVTNPGGQTTLYPTFTGQGSGQTRTISQHSAFNKRRPCNLSINFTPFPAPSPPECPYKPIYMGEFDKCTCSRDKFCHCCFLRVQATARQMSVGFEPSCTCWRMTPRGVLCGPCYCDFYSNVRRLERHAAVLQQEETAMRGLPAFSVPERTTSPELTALLPYEECHAGLHLFREPGTIMEARSPHLCNFSVSGDKSARHLVPTEGHTIRKLTASRPIDRELDDEVHHPLERIRRPNKKSEPKKRFWERQKAKRKGKREQITEWLRKKGLW